MRYMFLIYSEESETPLPPEESRAMIEAHHDVMEEARAKGVLEAAEPLRVTATATTVRRREGRAVVTDGPFAETKEALAGYYIIDCADLDEAIYWADKIPKGCRGGGGCVEIRPIGAIPQRGELPFIEQPSCASQ